MRARTALCCTILFTLSSFAQQLSPEHLKEWHWRLIGPSAPAGRAWTVVGVESDPKTLYVTTAAGGLWKSSDNGTTFIPMFNDQGSASTGAVAVAKSNTSIVWVGTGEPACTRANSNGDGAYKSTDGGATWKNMGLADSREISQIVIHPQNPDIVYVAAMGYLWGTNSERGIFKTTDGGSSWRKVLFVNDTTGFNDLQMDPLNPEIIYAAAWQRIRWGDGDMTESGPGSGIYKSTDGGGTWKKLSTGLPTDPMGKIHVVVGRRNPLILYANILTGEPSADGRTSKQGGLFRSEDGGASWTRTNERQTNYYYNRVCVDPADENTVWMPVFELNRSTDGGKTFEKVNMKHVHNDLHSMWIDPNDPSHIAVSGDGGVSISYNRCATWQQTVLPIAQFYEVAVDHQDPYFVMCGMQDTGHWFGPSRTYDEEGITAHDWIKLRYNGDGMGIASDPRDPNVIYMTQEFGNTSRLDLQSWDRTELQPTDSAELVRKGATHAVRWDWTPAFLLSQHDPDIVYLGSNYLFKINGRTREWSVISPDLSRQQDKILKGIVDGFHSYGALFSVAESPLDKDILWAGADDGPVWITGDGGMHWSQVDGNFPRGTPVNGVVSKIEASRFARNTAYLVYDNHTVEDLRPYVYKTTDLGKSWKSITGDLPRGSTFVLREDPRNQHVLYAGTDVGVYVTVDDGKHWTRLQSNLPTSPVRAMVIQDREQELVAATFGRAVWITDIAPFSEMNAEIFSEPLHLFATKPGVLFKLRETYGNTIEELNGDMFFRGENPPAGTFLTYYLRDNAGDSVRIAIKDGNGATLRSLKGPGTTGIHRVLWDLKREKIADTKAPAEDMTPGEREFNERVSPGVFTIEMSSGTLSARGAVTVRNETDAVRVANVRK